MLTLFGNLDSGNVHKVQMILRHTGLPFRRIDVRQDRGQPRDPRFLALNPMGKVPAVRLADGDLLSDSGALLFFFSEGTSLWPSAHRERAEVLRWMFFEQYSHEPALAVLRYLTRFAAEPTAHADRIAELEPRARFALSVMDERLSSVDWLAGAGPTIADLALYPYTAWMEEIGLTRATWPAVDAWLRRFESLPSFLPLYADGAVETLAFEAYFESPAVGLHAV